MSSARATGEDLPEIRDDVGERIPMVDFGDFQRPSFSLENNDDDSGPSRPSTKVGDDVSQTQLLPALPPYDRAPTTRLLCISGLVLSWAIGIACVAVGPWSLTSVAGYLTQSGGYDVDSRGTRTFQVGSIGQALIKLAVNVCITLGTDCLGHIHAVSLRWALWREGRLRYNSQIRLLNSTRGCSANRWSTNLVSAVFLMACYASAGQLFLAASPLRKQVDLVLNGVAMTTLGIGILGQAIISSLCLLKSSTLIPTWSSNPLNTTLVAMHCGLRPTTDRQSSSLALPRDPKSLQAARQTSLRRKEPRVLAVFTYLWLLFLASFIYTIVIWAGHFKTYPRRYSPLVLYFNDDFLTPELERNLCNLLITIALQGTLTLALHATELIVSADFDERLWQRVGTASGMSCSLGSAASSLAAASSWPNLVLWILKPVAHWVFGLTVLEANGMLTVSRKGLWYLTSVLLVLAVFGTYLVWREPKSRVPSTWGHLQSLADLVEEWPSRPADSLIWSGGCAKPAPSGS